MFRIVGGVFVGYVAMFVTIAFSLSILFFLLGNDRTFHAGNYEVTGMWLAGMVIVNLIAGMVGGKVCAVITARSSAVIALALVVLALGVLSANAGDAGKLTTRNGDASLREAIINAKEPTWFLLLLPVAGAAGVLAGGRVKK